MTKADGGTRAVETRAKKIGGFYMGKDDNEPMPAVQARALWVARQALAGPVAYMETHSQEPCPT